MVAQTSDYTKTVFLKIVHFNRVNFVVRELYLNFVKKEKIIPPQNYSRDSLGPLIQMGLTTTSSHNCHFGATIKKKKQNDNFYI